MGEAKDEGRIDGWIAAGDGTTDARDGRWWDGMGWGED